MSHAFPVFRFIASELSRVGDVIGQVRTVDIDSEKQSKVFYAITGGNEKGTQLTSYYFALYLSVL